MNYTYQYIKSGSKENIEKYILLSGSPRRASLLRNLNPEIRKTDIDERNIENRYMQKYESEPFTHRVGKSCCEISRAKSDVKLENNCLYISADTMVVMDGQIYNKPKNLKEARNMFLSYFGKTHYVITSVCLRAKDYEDTFYSIAEVEFVPYYDELSSLIDDYITRENVMDKAGAYGIQDLDPRFVKRISGDINTIIGLPVAEVFYRVFN
ncbi:nucleoside triphosphate pyrophosphatase [uncultured Anaerococcus sp.]|uniref:Maf family protein n=1 Tax=uncultured Anaerococcus sp. TaxID=293428 RepID=UPI002623EDF3|nr:Maf family protein [uncultured Anaerococcus sp.]